MFFLSDTVILLTRFNFVALPFADAIILLSYYWVCRDDAAVPVSSLASTLSGSISFVFERGQRERHRSDRHSLGSANTPTPVLIHNRSS